MFNFSFGGGGEDEEEEGSQQQRRGGRGGAGAAAAASAKADTTKFYEVLGVEKTATEDTIKKSFRKLAMIHHPDKGGDPEKFKQITRAYEILGNQKKRELYDQYGEEGVERGGGPPEGMDIFDILGGGMGRRQQQQRVRRGEDVVFPLKVDLNDLYNGASKKLRLTKNVICKGCNGKGGKADSVKKCVSCKGHGVKVVIRQVGPGMIQQMQMQCEVCKGDGQIIPDKDRCTGCKGERTVKEQKTLEVFVNRGMVHGQRIPFKGEADEAPDTEPGDVVVVLQQKEHPVFRRDGMNLFMKKKITLVEALTGFVFRIPHLDNRTLVVKGEDGAVVKPGDVKCIRDEGMPNPRHPSRKGNLYLEIDIEFPLPQQLTAQARVQLLSLLPGPPPDPAADKKKEAAAAAASTAAPATNGNAATAAAGAAKKKKNKKKKSAAAAAAAAGAPGGAAPTAADTADKEEEDDAKDSTPSDVPVEEEVSLEDVDMAEEKRKFAEQQREAYEEDGEDRPRGQGQPGCRAQ
jgi:DnaJ family protein A protein 2